MAAQRAWEKVAMRAAIRFVVVSLEIGEEKRPKLSAASLDHGMRKMLSEHAMVLDLEDLALSRYQGAFGRQFRHQIGST
jgi:hypothetical protein